MDRFRTPGVPSWVTVFVSLLGLMGVIVGVAAMADPSLFFFTEADDALGRRYAGRMLGLGFVTIGAVWLRSRSTYVLVLVAGVSREVGDGFGAATDGESVALALVTGAIGVAAIADIVRRDFGSSESAQARSTPTALG